MINCMIILEKVSNVSQMAQLRTLYSFQQLTHFMKDMHNLEP
jgi:flagellar hook assembly protein FlgD